MPKEKSSDIGKTPRAHDSKAPDVSDSKATPALTCEPKPKYYRRNYRRNTADSWVHVVFFPASLSESKQLTLEERQNELLSKMQEAVLFSCKLLKVCKNHKFTTSDGKPFVRPANVHLSIEGRQPYPVGVPFFRVHPHTYEQLLKLKDEALKKELGLPAKLGPYSKSKGSS